jgi:hypothetical protein
MRRRALVSAEHLEGADRKMRRMKKRPDDVQARAAMEKVLKALREGR